MPDWIRPSEAIAFDNRPTSASLYAPYLRVVLTSKSSRNIRDVLLRELMLDPSADTPTRLGGGFILGRGPDSGRAPKELSSRVISRQHVQLLVDKIGAVFIIDLNSTHGTIVRRSADTIKVHSKQPLQLRDGDQVTIGRPVLSGNLHDAVRFKVIFRHESSANTGRVSCPYAAEYFATSKDVPAIDAALYPRPTALVPNTAGRYGLEPSMLYESEPESLLPRGGSDSPGKNVDVINVVDDSDSTDSSSDEEEDDDDVKHLPPAEQSSPPTSVTSEGKSDEADEAAFDPEITICIPSSVVEPESQDIAEDEDDDDADAHDSDQRPSKGMSGTPGLADASSLFPDLVVQEDDHDEEMRHGDDPEEEEQQRNAPASINNKDEKAAEGSSLKIRLPTPKEALRLPPIDGPIEAPDLSGARIELPDFSGTARIELPFPAVIDLAGDSVPGSDETRRWSKVHLDAPSSPSSNDPDSVMMSFIAEPAPAQIPLSKSYEEDEDEYESWLAGDRSRSSSHDDEDDACMGSDYPEDEDEHDRSDWGSDDEDASDCASDNESVASEEHIKYQAPGIVEAEPMYEDAYATSELSDPESAMSEDEDEGVAEEDASDASDCVSDDEDVAVDSEEESDAAYESESDADSEEHDDEDMSEDEEQDQSEDEGVPKMSAISDFKLDGSMSSKTSSTASVPKPMLGLAYLSDQDEDGFSTARNTTVTADKLRSVTFSEVVRDNSFRSSSEGFAFSFEAPKAESQATQTQSSAASSKLPPSPANSTDGQTSSLSKALQTPDTKSSFLPSVGLATPPSPMQELKRHVEASAQTSLSPPRKRSHEEMEAEEIFETASSVVEPTKADAAVATTAVATTSTAVTTTTTTAGKDTAVTAPAPESDSPRPRKRRFLERLGFTAGVVVGAAGMFGTLLLLGEE